MRSDTFTLQLLEPKEGDLCWSAGEDERGLYKRMIFRNHRWRFYDYSPEPAPFLIANDPALIDAATALFP